MQSRFPFVAVVGQNQLKTALLLNTVDPSIGGLLVSGPRGSAKTTLVRSITDLGPDKAFVNVPLGASEEMVTGSFDLEKALADSELAFRPGLLSQADGGMLYVDEVNLLADHLVDLLLDCAASGINHVERDGISHSHEARFSLVGTMNPDEGELRPQLLDRFGMSCAVQTAFSPVERQEIVARRLAFDDDADEFRATWLAATDQVTRELADAVALLPTVSVSEEMSREIALRCQNANVEGFRADITMHRAAKAHAALHGRSVVNTEDLEAVENLVLDHRRKPGPDNRQDPASGNQDTSSGTTRSGSGGGSSIQGSWGAQPAVKVSGTAGNWHSPPRIDRPVDAGKARLEHANTRRRGNHLSRAYRPTSEREGKVDWRRTLARGQRFLDLDAGQRRNALRYKSPIRHGQDIDLVILDTSASVLEGGGLSLALGLLEKLAGDCYRQRRKLGIIVFGNDDARVLMHPQKPGKISTTLLENVTGGGGTPLLPALDLALNLLDNRVSADLCRVYLLTDGRVEDSAFRHSLFAHRHVTVVDMESGRVPLGRARLLAENTGAGYTHLQQLRSD